MASNPLGSGDNSPNSLGTQGPSPLVWKVYPVQSHWSQKQQWPRVDAFLRHWCRGWVRIGIFSYAKLLSSPHTSMGPRKVVGVDLGMCVFEKISHWLPIWFFMVSVSLSLRNRIEVDFVFCF